jgi:hypothetical protein
MPSRRQACLETTRASACFDYGQVAGDIARKGNQMKIMLAVSLFFAATQGALAAGSDCRTIKSTSQRLACYDAASTPKAEKPAAVAVDVPPGAYKDPFIEEDARTTAKLKNICRGC